MATDQIRFRRHHLPIGDDEIPVLVGSQGADPKTVFMSYDAFMELTATLYTAIEALREAGVEIPVDRGPSETDLEEFASWDDDLVGRPGLRLVSGGN